MIGVFLLSGPQTKQLTCWSSCRTGHGGVVDSISVVFPLVLGICSGWARKRILQHMRKLHFSLIACFAGVDARSAFISRKMQTLHVELHIAAHQRVVSVTVGALVAASCLDVGKVDTSSEDQVELMPVFRSRLSPGDPMLLLTHNP